MFWALAQRRKWQAQLRAEGAAAADERYRQWLSKVAVDLDIPFERLMPPAEYLPQPPYPRPGALKPMAAMFRVARRASSCHPKPPAGLE